MGATAIDVAREFQVRLNKLEHVVAVAFVEYLPARSQLRLTTLLHTDDPEAERQLAQAELDIEDAFREFPLEFSTVHLRGRDPKEFIPDGAFVIFGQSARRRADATK